MKNHTLFLAIIFLVFGNSVTFGQCSPNTVTHYNVGDFPATLTGGVSVSFSSTSSISSVAQFNESCGYTEINSIGLFPMDSASYTFSQTVYSVAFVMGAMNMGERGSIYTNAGIPTISTPCSSSFTISGNYFERTAGPENYNCPPIYVTIPGGATSVTIVCDSTFGIGTGAWTADLLDCYTITGLNESNLNDKIQVYPNPTDGNFSIDLGKVNTTSTVSITDLTGRLIQSNNYLESKLLSLKLEEPAGVYLVKIESGEKSAIIKLIKNK